MNEDVGTVVQTQQGALRGRTANGVTAFKDVPYEPGRRRVMRFGEPSAVVDDLHAERRAVWDGVR